MKSCAFFLTLCLILGTPFVGAEEALDFKNSYDCVASLENYQLGKDTTFIVHAEGNRYYRYTASTTELCKKKSTGELAQCGTNKTLDALEKLQVRALLQFELAKKAIFADANAEAHKQSARHPTLPSRPVTITLGPLMQEVVEKCRDLKALKASVSQFESVIETRRQEAREFDGGVQ